MNDAIILFFLAMFAFFDIKSKKIPLCLIMIFGIVAVLVSVLGSDFDKWAFLAKMMPGVFLLLISFISNQAIGYGDGLIVLLIGLLTPLHINISLILAAFLLSALASIIVLVLKKGTKNSKLPFVPFLLSAWVLVMFWM
ncbi:MAG: hypothetical protein FWC09_01160 [Lachnospiraceae bacterium]|nr:hypothetical protein [Lachnospiraceae bacterium]